MITCAFRCVHVLMVAIVWSVLSIASVFAESQTVGSTANPGDVQIVVDDLGSVRFLRNDAGVINHQWLCPGANCTNPSNGVAIGFNDGTAKQFRSRFFSTGTVVTPVSNTLDGNRVLTVYRLGSSPNDPLVTQEVILDALNKLYDISWTIEVPGGGASLSSLTLIAGGDTNLLGNDYGYGAWDASSSTVSVRPDPAEGSGAMSLIGVTVPQGYEGRNYTAVQSSGNSQALTNVVSPTTVDIGMALQWNVASVAAGSSVTIRAVVVLNTTTELATPTPGVGTPAATATPTRTSTPTATATSSSTPSITPSGTPTASPTASPTPTHTASPTSASTGTVTPTQTVTSTPTFNLTPDPGTGGVAPPLFQPLNGGGTSSSRPILRGTAAIGGSVVIFIDGVNVGSAVVTGGGTFSFQVPSPLAVGDHVVVGKTVLSDGNESAYSQPMVLTIRREAVLDFDGDGITDITGHAVRGATTSFRSALSASKGVSSENLTGWMPAPADYDGDGRWDYGAVGVAQGALRWSLKLSGSGVAKEVALGSSGDIALVGCRFGDGGSYALSVMKGRHVRYRTLNGRSRGAFSVHVSDMGQVLGCGDVDGDGVDELIVATRESRQLDRVTAVTRTGKRLQVINISRFINGFIARDVGSGSPILGALRGSGKDSKSSELRALRGTFEFPVVQLPSSLDVASGTFMRRDNVSLTSGILWQRRGTLDLLRMLAREKHPTKVFKLPKGYRVTKPQNNRRVSGSRRRR